MAGGLTDLQKVSQQLGDFGMVDSGCVDCDCVVGASTLASMSDGVRQRLGHELANSGNKYVFGKGEAGVDRTVEFNVEARGETGQLLQYYTVRLDIVTG